MTKKADNKSKSAMGDVVRNFNAKDMAKAVSQPLSKGGRSNGAPFTLTAKGVEALLAGKINGQQEVIVKALASLYDEATDKASATTAQLVERIDKMRNEDPAIERVMYGKENQGTLSIVSHYRGSSTPLLRKGYVTMGGV